VSSGYACDRLPTFIGYPSFGGASGQPPTSLVAASFSATFCSAFDLRRLPHLPALRSDQLPTLHRILRLPAVPFDQLPTFIGCCIVRFCLRTRPLTFVEGPILGLCFQADRRLSSVIAPSGSAFQPTSDSSPGIASSNFTFRSTSDLRRRSTLRFCPSTNFRLSSDIASFGFALGRASDFHRMLRPPALSVMNLRSRSEFESSSYAVDLLPTCIGC